MIEFQHIVIIGAGIGILVAGYFFYKKLMDGHEDEQFGKVMLQYMDDNNVTISFLTVLFIIIGESMMAAGLVDEHSNVAARLITHLTIGFLSFVGALKAIDSWKQLYVCLHYGLYGSGFLQFWVASIYTLLMIGGPICNTLIMANGYHQMDTLDLAWKYLWLNDTEFQYQVIYAGKDWPYNPWSEMNNALMASVMLNIFSAVLILLDVLMHSMEAAAKPAKPASTAETKEKESKTPPTTAPNPPPAAPNVSAEVISHFEKVFGFYGYSGPGLQEKVKEATAASANLIDTEKIAVAKTVAEIVAKIKTVEAITDSTERANKTKELKGVIRTRLGAPTGEGGLKLIFSTAGGAA